MRNYRDLYRKSRAFPKEEFYGLTSQMRRCVISIGANLVEGCGRQSTAELARFVRISMGSASELDYHLLLCHDFGYLPEQDYRIFIQELTRIRKMLASLLATLESAPRQNPVQKAKKAAGNGA